MVCQLRRIVLVAIALVAVGHFSPAHAAEVASDQPAGLLVFPKILVDTAPAVGQPAVDTLVRVSNVSNRTASLHCFWVNANGHCHNSPQTVCNPRKFAVAGAQCPNNGLCLADWTETDFTLKITPAQPVAWLASTGAVLCGPGVPNDPPCLPLSARSHPGPNGQDNEGSSVLPVSEDPFIGYLKCLQVDSNGSPVDRNDLRGEVEIVRIGPGETLDVSAYNAIGIPAIPGRNNQDDTLVLGGEAAEYSSCPNILILDHFFDGATDPVSQKTVTTDLTLVPCSEDYARQIPVSTTAQYLVFNEFEQRFSTARVVTCFDDILISNINSSSATRSLFSAAVAGTLTGQTRIRGVGDSGHTLLGVAEEFREEGGTAAFNLHFHGTRPGSDHIFLPAN